MLLLRPSVSSWKSCWKDDVRIKGAGMVRLQHCFGHDHVNFLLLPFLFPSMSDHGGGPLCLMLSKPAELSQRHNAFLVEQVYFQGLGLSEMWMPAWEPLGLPLGGQGRDKKPITVYWRISSTSVPKCSHWNLPFWKGLGRWGFII